MNTRADDKPLTRGGADVLMGAALGAASLAVYLRTLAPGLVPILDTPVFQFVGRVLGVPHNPGYPFYVLLTHVYSALPVGTLAWRMNLFSALMGALTTTLVFATCRTLGCGRTASATAALGLAFGRVFWSQAVIAEVYTLNTALVGATLLAICRWDARRRATDFRVAVACLAAGLGNHTTIVLFVPGLAAFTLLADARFATGARQLAWVAAMAVASLAQYAFIIIRTGTPGAYVESPAHNVHELAGVIRGRQFESGLFAYPWTTVLHERFPAMSAIVAHELSVVGVVLAAIGIVVCLRTRPRHAVLLGSGALLTFLFAANYDAVDIYVFLIPVFLVLWMFVAIAIDGVARVLRPGAASAAVLCSLVLPAVLLARNFAMNDLSHDVTTAAYFKALIAGLPPGASIVHEDFLIDRMVMYEVLGERAAPPGLRFVDRDAAAVRGRLSAGAAVFAFPLAADRLRADGILVDFAWRQVPGSPLRQYARELPPGTRFAYAVPRALRRAFEGAQESAPAGEGLAVIEGSRSTSPSPPASLASRTITIETAHGPEQLAIVAEADAASARVVASGRPLAETAEGAAFVTWTPDGAATAGVARADDAFRVPLVERPFALSQVRPPNATSDPLAGLLRPTDAHTARITMSRDEQSQLAIDGWGQVDADATGPFRFIAGSPARLHLPATRPMREIVVTLRATDAGPYVVTGTLGGTELGTAVVTGSGWRAWRWTVPPGAAGDLRLSIDPRAENRVAVGDVVLRYTQER